MEKILKLVILANANGLNLSFELRKSSLVIYVFNDLNKIQESFRFWLHENNNEKFIEMQADLLAMIGNNL